MHCNLGAVGGGRLQMPDGVGLLIDETKNLIIMETHYDNPTGDEDAVDVSGTNLYFSDSRPIEAGVLSLGDFSVSLAPLMVQNDFKYQSTCPTNCTERWGSELNVFGSFMHMHRTGREIYTNRFDKDGNFLETINGVGIDLRFTFAAITY